ncbi:MAG: X-Pro dipeptidyl-peptidase, partial [Bacillota bacterium]
MNRHVLVAILTAGAFAPVARGATQEPAAYERRELTIPMRDGTKLFAVALIPRGVSEPLPIILIRTPYSAAGAFRTAELPARFRELGRDGYIF